MPSQEKSMRNLQSLSVLILLLFSLAGCIQGGGGTAEAVPLQPTAFLQPTSAIQTVALHTATPVGPAATAANPEDEQATAVTGEPARPGQWVELRDQRYGFALAAPCWWVVSPIPAEGLGGVMTLRNYDDAFFMNNSTKGWWTAGDWPEGVMKLDLVVWEGFDPALSTLEAYRTSFDSSTSELVSVKEVRIGEKEALLVEMRNLVNTADPNSRLYLFRPQDDLLLMVSAAPDRALDSSDVQAILGSLALTASQTVALPQLAPSPAIISMPEGCLP